MGCLNQISSSLCFNHIAIYRYIVELVKHNNETSDTAVSHNDITGISKHHPRNVFMISKIDNASQLKTITEKN